MKRAFCLLLLAAAAMPQQALKPVPPLGVEVPAADRAELESGLTRLRAAIDKMRGQSAAAGRPHLPRSRPVRASVQRVLPPGRNRQSQNAAAARRGARAAAGRRQVALDHAAGPGRARLRVEDRQERPAVRAGGAAVLLADRAASMAAGRLVPRAQRDAERGQLPLRPRAQSRRIHAARHDRAAPLRALLQRQQARRRSGFLRSAGRREAPVPDRREPHPGARLQHGRRVGLAVRHALCRTLGGGRAGRGIQRIGAVPQAQSHRPRRAGVVGAEALPLRRRHRLRRESYQHRDRRLQRRQGRPEAGRRHDGARHGGRRNAADPHRRAARPGIATIRIRRSRSTASWTRSPSAAAIPIRGRCASPPGRWPTTR